MAATKEKLIKICDDLSSKNLITGPYSMNYSIRNGHIALDVKKPGHKKAIKEHLKNLGYVVRIVGYGVFEVYWEEDVSEINEIFNKYE